MLHCIPGFPYLRTRRSRIEGGTERFAARLYFAAGWARRPIQAARRVRRPAAVRSGRNGGSLTANDLECPWGDAIAALSKSRGEPIVARPQNELDPQAPQRPKESEQGLISGLLALFPQFQGLTTTRASQPNGLRPI